MNLREAVIQRLSSSPGEKLKARDLADWLISTYPEACQKKAATSGFTTHAQLRNQLVAEIGSNRPAWQKKYPALQTTAERPRLYFWSNLTDEQAVQEAETVGDVTPKVGHGVSLPLETALYGPVGNFLRSEFNAHAMRIDEKKASNKKGPNANKWLFPDLCAMESLVGGMDAEVLALLDLTGADKVTLYSIEVKVVLNTSNVRESFFQTVSNSSWANFGYLIAAQVDDKVLEELRMLHGLHGIGVALLDVEDPLESQVLIPARFNEQVDWGTFNRLTVENPDFRAFAMRVKHFHQTNSISASGWKIPT
jgi:uncharacterized protein